MKKITPFLFFIFLLSAKIEATLHRVEDYIDQANRINVFLTRESPYKETQFLDVLDNAHKDGSRLPYGVDNEYFLEWLGRYVLMRYNYFMAGCLSGDIKESRISPLIGMVNVTLRDFFSQHPDRKRIMEHMGNALHTISQLENLEMSLKRKATVSEAVFGVHHINELLSYRESYNPERKNEWLQYYWNIIENNSSNSGYLNVLKVKIIEEGYEPQVENMNQYIIDLLLRVETHTESHISNKSAKKKSKAKPMNLTSSYARNQREAFIKKYLEIISTEEEKEIEIDLFNSDQMDCDEIEKNKFEENNLPEIIREMNTQQNVTAKEIQLFDLVEKTSLTQTNTDNRNGRWYSEWDNTPLSDDNLRRVIYALWNKGIYVDNDQILKKIGCEINKKNKRRVASVKNHIKKEYQGNIPKKLSPTEKMRDFFLKEDIDPSLYLEELYDNFIEIYPNTCTYRTFRDTGGQIRAFLVFRGEIHIDSRKLRSTEKQKNLYNFLSSHSHINSTFDEYRRFIKYKDAYSEKQFNELKNMYFKIFQ